MAVIIVILLVTIVSITCIFTGANQHYHHHFQDHSSKHHNQSEHYDHKHPHFVRSSISSMTQITVIAILPITNSKSAPPSQS
jgi:hypothetical protein